MKPILFNTEMVRAILDNRKTATRRPIKDMDIINGWDCEEDGTPIAFIDQATGDSYPATMPCPYHPSDILYVRETWGLYHQEPGFYVYKADKHVGEEFDGFKWRPSIHMPREAARLFLRVTGVRAERLQDITEEQAVKEGFEAYHSDSGYYEPATLGFVETWNSTIKPKDQSLYGWNANPWVWVIEFERCENP